MCRAESNEGTRQCVVRFDYALVAVYERRRENIVTRRARNESASGV